MCVGGRVDKRDRGASNNEGRIFWVLLIRCGPAFFYVIRQTEENLSRCAFFLDIIIEVYILIFMARSLMTNKRGKRALDRLRKIKPFVQASLTLTKKRCSNPGCRCLQEGPQHEVALLTWKEEKRTRTLYVPIELRQEVAKWVQEGKLLKRLVAEMSEAQREFLISMKKRRKSDKG
jgi:hypothetical protein